jgi:hypothetical protein
VPSRVKANFFQRKFSLVFSKDSKKVKTTKGGEIKVKNFFGVILP